MTTAAPMDVQFFAPRAEKLRLTGTKPPSKARAALVILRSSTHRRRISSLCAAWVTLCLAVAASPDLPADPPGRGSWSLFPRAEENVRPKGDGQSGDRESILDSLPLERLTPEARQRILRIAEKPTLYRRLPTQAIGCDREMFLFLTRNPDVMVGMWDLMGVTKVQSKRLGPYHIEASDQMGTLCTVDLVYGDSRVHIFVVEGSYDGKLTPTPIRGQGVFVLHSNYALSAEGRTTVSGTLDCFIQLDSLGVDLIVRTLSPIIGRSADSNFEQTARFMAQVNEASIRNPPAMLKLADKLPQVTPPLKSSFAETIVTVARRGQTLAADRSRTSTR